MTARLNSCGTPVADATVTVTFDNNDATINLYDDGAHNDGVANDGVYGGIWQPFTIGPVTMTVDSSHASMGDRTVSVSGIVTDLVDYTYQADTYNWIDTTTGTAYTLSDDSGVTIPVALDKAGMPVGLQLVGASGTEERVLATALACERHFGTAREQFGVPPLLA